MRIVLCLSAILLSLPAIAADINTVLDFDSLFPDISKASLKHEAKLQKKNGGTPLTPHELSQLYAQLTQELTTKRNNAVLQVRAQCYDEISHFCGHYERFSDGDRACITAYRPHFSARCNTALHDNIGEVLAEDTLIERLIIPQKSKLIYDANNRIIGAISPIKSTHNGILFKSGEMRFKNGIVTAARLPQDTRIQGIMFRGLDKKGMLFHPNGAVKRGMLAQDTHYQGVTLKGGTEILLHPNRFFRTGILAENVTIAEKTYKAGTYLYANEEGEISDDHAILIQHTRQKNAPQK